MDPTTQVSLVKVSPLFVAHDYGFGSAQYMDALQRDTFDSTNGYHVKLGTPTVMATHVVHIPSSSGAVIRTNSGYVGVVETNYLLNLISHLPHTLGVKTSTLPIMVSHDVYAGSIPPANSSTTGSMATRRFPERGQLSDRPAVVWSSWIDEGFFANPKTLDITGFTHEVAEAVERSFLATIVRRAFCGRMIAVDCNTLIEVGDVIEGCRRCLAPRVGEWPYLSRGECCRAAMVCAVGSALHHHQELQLPGQGHSFRLFETLQIEEIARRENRVGLRFDGRARHRLDLPIVYNPPRMISSVSIRRGHVIDPANNIDRPMDVLLRDGRVAASWSPAA